MNKLKTFIIAFITFILQITVFSKIDIFGANVNIVIGLVISLSLILGSKSGAYTGLVIGLLEDFMFSNIIGIRALSYFLIGYIVADDRSRFNSDKNTGLILSFVFTIINFIFVSLITYIFKADIIVIKNYLFIPLLVEAVLNTLVYLIYHFVIKKLMYIPTYRI
ncbi:MAG: rod shape-determining protein MreD [Anaerococcus hydrogenalis]|uniref:rod shape-determining protein MreD n=1 Tax=Anaerococcus hydrogenalis TaxID=33029 RepID=UPI0028FE181F|nr:rod shape-determining protein MreD [Anaerococcus hydrogenalis]MDU3153176.1 rod shape-determining protein MreD [Anaerococcus hydrogenalis]MDU3687251.1 rod shape-determining protein MreD [Anaerococcus hydrogenalis]